MGGLRRFLEKLKSQEHNHTLWVTHASRNDAVLGLLSHKRQFEHDNPGKFFQGGMILCGEKETMPGGGEVQDHVAKAIAIQDGVGTPVEGCGVPMLYVQLTMVEVMTALTNYRAKFNASDKERIEACISNYEPHIDFERLLA